MNTDVRRFGIDSETWEYLDPWEPYDKDPAWCEVPPVKRRAVDGSHPTRKRKEFAWAHALRDARMLAELFSPWETSANSPETSDGSFGFPIVWERQLAYLFFPDCRGTCPYDESYPPVVISVERALDIVNDNINDFVHFFVDADASNSPGLRDVVDFGPRCGSLYMAEDAPDIVLQSAKGRTVHEIVMAMASSRIPKAPIPRWMLDTGCGNDLVSLRSVAKLAKHVRDAANPLTFNTANGLTKGLKDIMMSVPELLEIISPYISESSLQS